MANATVGFLPTWYSTANGVVGAHTGRTKPIYGIAQSAIGFSGLYKIAGISKLAGVPQANHYITLAPADKPTLIVSTVRTAADGSFLFDGIAPGRYDVQGYDLSQTYNTIGKVNVLAVPR
jgi:hypothetical protein